MMMIMMCVEVEWIIQMVLYLTGSLFHAHVRFHKGKSTICHSQYCLPQQFATLFQQHNMHFATQCIHNTFTQSFHLHVHAYTPRKLMRWWCIFIIACTANNIINQMCVSLPHLLPKFPLLSKNSRHGIKTSALFAHGKSLRRRFCLHFAQKDQFSKLESSWTLWFVQT